MRALRVDAAARPPPSDVGTDDSTIETRAFSPRLEAVAWLVATLIVVAPVRVAGPGVGLDPGWAAGLNLGRQATMSFGRELIFTFGPWGFLDAPLAMTRSDFMLGLGFSVASVVAAWLFMVAVLRSKLHPRLALVVASLTTILIAGVSSPSLLLTSLALVGCVRHLRQSPARSTPWFPVAVACLAALLLQVKFSEGVAITLIVFVTSLASPRARLKTTVCSVLIWMATFISLWVLAGQSMADLGPWLRASTQFVTGYTKAMSQAGFSPALALVCYGMALLLIVSILILGMRGRPVGTSLSYVGAVAVTLGALYFGFKQAFTREGVEHNAAFFVIATLFLWMLLERGPRWRATVLLITVSTLMASPALCTYVRGNPVDSWMLTLRILTSDASRSALLNQARAEDQTAYGLPKGMVEATHGHSVAVDPWEVSMVWAYSMTWSPMPVFQSYSAYTADLDQVNADVARLAKDDQMIIRATTVPDEDRITIIDRRNPMWEAPRYTLTVVCNYSLVTADKRWMLLRKGADRCGDSSPIGAARPVLTGEPIQVPNAGVDQIVTASFIPAKPSALVSLTRFAFKDPEPLTASVDGVSFRLPEELASGPLLTVLPRGFGWPAQFRANTQVRSISFSRPGKVQFQTIRLIG